MKKFTAILFAMMFAILAIVPVTGACAASANEPMYVSSDNGHGVNLRASASTSAKLIAKLGEAKPVTFVKKVNDSWSEVIVRVDGKDVKGYVMSKYISIYDPTALPQTFTKVSRFNVKVNPSNGASGHVNLRAHADVTATCLAYLQKGETLTVIAESHAWYQVKDTHGHTGYVVKAFVTK